MLRALATCLVLICASIATVYAKPVRILFVGNELTETADIPARLAGLAKAMGRDATVESITVASYALEDHWRDGRALAAIAKGWDFVVLQQGPSAAPDERVQLVEFARRLRVRSARRARSPRSS